MAVKQVIYRSAISMLVIAAITFFCGEVAAQRRAPFQLGGPDGIVAGGGQGFRIGGRNGIQFGGGQGARFGPPEFGMQFGGGQGARFGSPEYGMQFGHGEGARFGQQGAPLMQFGGGQGATIGAHLGEGRKAIPAQDGAGPDVEGQSATPNVSDTDRDNTAPQPTPAANGTMINIRYPSNAKEPFGYSLNGTQSSFAPGTSLVLPVGHRWDFRIPADRTGQQLRYSNLKPGDYVIRQGESGWQLFEEKKPAPRTIQVAKPSDPMADSEIDAPSVLENDK